MFRDLGNAASPTKRLVYFSAQTLGSLVSAIALPNILHVLIALPFEVQKIAHTGFCEAGYGYRSILAYGYVHGLMTFSVEHFEF
jgi:hypothetical protein